MRVSVLEGEIESINVAMLLADKALKTMRRVNKNVDHLRPINYRKFPSMFDGIDDSIWTLSQAVDLLATTLRDANRLDEMLEPTEPSVVVWDFEKGTVDTLKGEEAQAEIDKLNAEIHTEDQDDA